MIRENQRFLNRVLFLLDSITALTALYAAWWLRFESNLLGQVDIGTRLTKFSYLIPALYIIPLYLFINYLIGLYSPQRASRFSHEFVLIIKSNLIVLLLVMSILFFIKEIHYSRLVLLIFLILNIILSTVERLTLRWFLRYIRNRGYNKKYLLILGAGRLGREFYNKISHHQEYGYEILGFLDDDPEKLGKSIGSTKILGKLEQLPEILTSLQIDEVIIALPVTAYKRIANVIDLCEKYGVKVLIIPDFFDLIPAKPRISDLDGIPLIDIRHVPLDEPVNKIIKRLFDIVFSLSVLVLLCPLFILIAIGVKLSSPGPVFFSQERIGLYRRPFKMYKFRSMYVCDDTVSQTQWTVKNDPRRTKFGTFLRRTSLDELPQFWNVLKGDMSVIGPRPERPYFVEQFKERIPKYMIKHHVRPGITGWAQVNGWRGDTSIEERIKCDLYYVENWTFSLDIKIIIMTILNGFFNKNAY